MKNNEQQDSKKAVNLKIGKTIIPVKEPFNPWALLVFAVVVLIFLVVVAALNSKVFWTFSGGASVLGSVAWVITKVSAKTPRSP
jgi:hypothetical protein